MAEKADVLMLLGRAFHKVAAATTNELSPAFMYVHTTVNKLLFAVEVAPALSLVVALVVVVVVVTYTYTEYSLCRRYYLHACQ